jgi:hypothetical protein
LSIETFRRGRGGPDTEKTERAPTPVGCRLPTRLPSETGLRVCNRVTGHPCKSLSSEKHNISGRAPESALRDLIRISCYAVFASRLGVPALAEPDIHLLSKTPRSPHRRLSLCSLPVPKQFGGSLWSVTSFAQSPTCGIWQPAHRRILMFLFFPYWKRFFTLPPYI